jgi:hypothetical protein
MDSDKHSFHPVDERLAGYLSGVSQRSTSRRGLLVRLGRVILGLTGLSLIPVLPADRRFGIVRAQVGGNELCGPCGNLCVWNCDCGGGGNGGCPSCLKKGAGGWSACCQPPDVCAPAERYIYKDCCSSAPNAGSCKGAWISAGCGNPDIRVWCRPE